MKSLLTTALTCFLAATAASASTIGQKAEKLQQLAGEYARNDEWTVVGSSPLAMVKGYMLTKLAEDPGRYAEYRFKRDARSIAVDVDEAGTIDATAAIAALDREYFTPKQLAYAETLIREIEDAGGAFGYDGGEQNGCAAPTPFILVLDSAERKVYGIDLNPCTE